MIDGVEEGDQQVMPGRAYGGREPEESAKRAIAALLPH
jgi:hypothetical protein